jgi:tRNA (guanine-N7-)-methyltransferase
MAVLRVGEGNNMGRRALRKLDPNLDLTSYLYELQLVPKPFDPDEFFGRIAPLEIEIGSGKGLFLQNAAAAHPHRHFVGLEIAKKYAAYCAARLARHRLANGKIICGDALGFLRDWLPDRCADAVHVYFPDPWWKKRHKKRRVLNETAARHIERILQPRGKLHFWTDVEEYFQTTLELFAEHSTLKGPIEEPEAVPQHDLDFRTHFERRCRREEQPVYRAVFMRAELARGPE